MAILIRRELTLKFLVAVLAFLMVGSVKAQDDPDPNSPTPVVLTQSSSIYALAAPDGLRRMNINNLPVRPFPENGRVVLFVTNLSLMTGEGAKAFRLNVRDAQGRSFRFPVVDITEYPYRGPEDVYAVTVQLSDETGYWGSPAEGDVLVSLTWRGLASNPVLIGYGQNGGPLSTFQAVPMPLGRSYRSLTSALPSTAAPNYSGYRWASDRMRFQEQAAFGPSPALDNQVRRIGLKAWLVQQFDLPYPSASNPYPAQPLKPSTAPADCDGDQTVVPDVPSTCFRDTYTMYQPQTWFMREALYGDAQLRHRVAWALAQIWVTSGVDIQQGRHMVEYYKILANNAFGNYRTLMKQMTLNATMGDYLNMAVSTKNNPNENYAREIMQLFTVGLFQLHQDGTLRCIEHDTCQAGDTPMPTYDQNNVNNLTKVLTGWTFCQTPGASCPNLVSGTVNYVDPLLLNTTAHDLTAKTLLTWPADPAFPPNNSTIAACTNCTNSTNIATYANSSMDAALDNIFNHPNVGPFVSKILIQHLVTSDPTPQYVARVAAVFNNNGSGVRGDLKAVVKAILLDPEARGDVKTDPGYGKLREPVQYATNLMRAMNVRSANGTTNSDGYLTGRAEFNGMSQIPFQSPTVFNFYPPGYVVPGTSALGPEFAILNTGTAISRANFINRFVYTAPAIPADATNAPNGTSLDFSDLVAISTADPTANQLLDELDRRMMHGTMTPAMRSSLLSAVTAVSVTDGSGLSRVRQAVYLVATSTQYQVQR